jgi:hypothetical protein
MEMTQRVCLNPALFVIIMRQMMKIMTFVIPLIPILARRFFILHDGYTSTIIVIYLMIILTHALKRARTGILPVMSILYAAVKERVKVSVQF